MFSTSTPSGAHDAYPEKKRALIPTSGTYPRKFCASGVYTGVKKRHPAATAVDGEQQSLSSSSSRAAPPVSDLALVVSTASPSTTVSAAVFTRNLFCAAPVTVSRDVLRETGGVGVNTVVINAGCANAVTGARGLKDAWTMSKCAEHAVTHAKCVEEDPAPSNTDSSTGDDGKSPVARGPRAAVMSTGVIGQHLAMEKIGPGVEDAASRLGDTHAHWLAAAEAVMTTDTFPKLRSRAAVLPSSGLEYRLAGFSKGAGMIHPNMATMLSVVATDAPVRGDALRSALTYAVERSFNSITIDGDTSTNDTLLVMANGACLDDPKGAWVSDHESEDYIAFRDELTSFTAELAQLIVRDGEGATKFITIRVINAATYDIATAVAKSVATSSLVKTALYGRDANWGRVLCAVGYTEGVYDGGDAVDPSKVSLTLWNPDGATNFDVNHPLHLLTAGEPEPFDEGAASNILAEEDIGLTIDLGDQNGKEATVWTCDFSHEYVTINGSYRS